jgi:preprotein translocase subunit Sec61beta
MDGADRRAERFRSFVVGGLIGASAVIATARRRRRARARRAAPHAAGLAAFEDAPCYEETIEGEAATSRASKEPGRR